MKTNQDGVVANHDWVMTNQNGVKTNQDGRDGNQQMRESESESGRSFRFETCFSFEIFIVKRGQVSKQKKFDKTNMEDQTVPYMQIARVAQFLKR